MFKSIVPAIVIASALAVPALAQAQNNGALTRAEVRAQLVQLERAGYNPASDHATYPVNIQAAQARVNAQQGVAESSFGGATDGAFASGRAVSAVDAVGYDRP
ncbi:MULTISPECIES: DUF4148 domain-containing protein [unclassified Caballeronia]|uniref:DUF4148 domain-containing protein n=1 Tax=unclassified Caballeronia TaxID=2646786 RepID=UPI002866FD21|nr:MULTISPECIES: DUF4148 domain-containing protein [unclassified Caballeronia]MDR5737634.1 DUF4148 domain-containing protein [Caballeronia sp. LZ016]MDR5809834.1 DUF4148 domain-containing protein [Caballeronia sp. LZ019]